MPDDLYETLRVLDPAAHEEPPAPGSARYERIRPRLRPRRTVLTWAAAGAVAAAAAVVTVVAVGAQGAPPQDVVLVAAETTSEVTSLRGTTEVDPRDGGHRSATIEVSGADSAIVTRDGDVTVTSVVVGDTFYERASDDPNPRTGKAEPAGRLAPFASSTGAVVRAALQGAEVDDRGEEKVRGATTTHYRLTMTAAARKALGALSPGQTAWFELEYPDEVSTIDIWAAGDLIRRITVQQESQRSTTEFYDFNQPITIAVPPGF